MRALKKIQYIIAAIFLPVLFFACEGFHEAIVPLDLDVYNVETVLVINAEIEMDNPVWVQISYSENIDALSTTAILFEEQASICLSTVSGDVEKLLYNSKGIYYGSRIRGQIGEEYTLDITIGEQSYMATSTMLAPPGYQGGTLGASGAKDSSGGYSEEWVVNDPSDQRNRYLFEWWTNGQHLVYRDWAIDDNRVVNANEGLRLFNPTSDPGENEYTVLRTAEIDKLTYDYFNMYEKIVRGIVSVESQTPYNPVSNFGQRTMGNFRAVAFSSLILMTPPSIQAMRLDHGVEIRFPFNTHFAAYNLYWQRKPGVSKESEVLRNIDFENKNKNAVFVHNIALTDTLYYRIEAEDYLGNVSVLSAEESSADSGSGGPSNVKLIAEPGQIRITWDPFEGATGYGIYWSTKSGVTEKSSFMYNEKNPLLTSYTHNDLSSGVTYYYRVAAFLGDKGEYKEVKLSEEVSSINMLPDD